MHMKLKFFEGNFAEVEQEFNAWSHGKYISDTNIVFKNRLEEQIILKVLYGEGQRY